MKLVVGIYLQKLPIKALLVARNHNGMNICLTDNIWLRNDCSRVATHRDILLICTEGCRKGLTH